MPKTAAKREFLLRKVSEEPEYGEILPLFQALYQVIEGQEDRTGIGFDASAPPGRIRDGFPLLTAEALQVDADQAAAFLMPILAAMVAESKDGIADLNRLGQAISAGSLDFRTLFAACLSRERKVLQETAAALAIAEPLLEFVLEVPLKTALEAFAEKIPLEHVDGWSEGYCPICGSRAGMGEICGEEGKRFLSCSSCSFKWPYKRLQCPYCGNEDPETLSYFIVGEGPTRVDVCRKCSRYLKTRDARLGNGDVPLEAEDLATIHLDLVAGKEGFERGK